MSQQTIFLVHHGETEWNREGRLQGQLDSPLTPEGRSQATRVAALLTREIPRPRAVSLVSSSLGRAVDTAGIVGGVLDLPVAIDDRIIELSFGRWEGLTKEEMETQTPGAFDGASRWNWYFRAPGGESFEHASARIDAWLGELRQSTIAVGHGLAGRILRGLYAGLTREETLRQPVRRDGVFKLADGGITFVEAPPIL